VCLLTGTQVFEAGQLFLPGLVIGFGLALGQFGQPFSQRPGAGVFLLRLSLVLLPVLAVQSLAFNDPSWNAASMFYSPDKILQSFSFSEVLAPWFSSSPWSLPFLSLIDAALVSTFMTVGMFIGFSRGQNRINRHSHSAGGKE
jgi:hypothetical protein